MVQLGFGRLRTIGRLLRPGGERCNTTGPLAMSATAAP
jgi:hypothetical protein